MTHYSRHRVFFLNFRKGESQAAARPQHGIRVKIVDLNGNMRSCPYIHVEILNKGNILLEQMNESEVMFTKVLTAVTVTYQTNVATCFTLHHKKQ